MIADRKLAWSLGKAGLTLFIILVMGANSAGADVISKQLNVDTLDRGSKWDFRLDGQGGLWLSYYDLVSKLHLRDPAGQERILVEPVEEFVPSGLAMAKLREGVSVLWRQKFPNKKMFLINSNHRESDPLEFGEGTDPLTRFKLAEMDGTLHMLWYGERGDPLLKQKYFLYYQNLNNHTGEMSTVERIAPGIYPAWAHDAAGNIMVFSWVKDDQGSRVVAKMKGADKAAFGQEITLAKIPPVSNVFNAFRSGNRWFIVWLAKYDSFMTEGAYTDDFGKTWKRFTFDELKDFNVDSLHVATNEEGGILLALGGNDKTVSGSKDDIRLIRSMDRGETWKITRPRPEAISEKFHAFNPVVEFGPLPGQVLMAWEDWRNIRAQLFTSFSTDNAASWEYDNLALPQPKGINRGLMAGSSSIYLRDGTFHIVAVEPVDDRIKEINLVDVGFTREDLGQIFQSTRKTVASPDKSANASDVQPPGEAEKEGLADPASAALAKRVNEFWQAMMAKEFEKTYAIQDPFYRANMNVDIYKSQMGRIHYKDAVIESITIDGALARVNTRVMAEVKPFRAKTGEMISKPAQEIKMEEIWLWIDDEWYREYYSEYHDRKYTRY